MDAAEHSINALLNRAYLRIQAFYDFYRMTPEDFPFFQKESPSICQTIEKIEETGILHYEDMRVICHKWIENYHLLFKRRAYFRRV